MIQIPAIPELQFEEASHIYLLNGLEIPSVTSVMEPLSRYEYSRVDERTLDTAAHRGTAIHNSIENWIKFGLEDVDPEFQGYMDGFLEWWNLRKPEVIGSEVRIYHKLMRYAGTADMVAIIDGKLNLIDFKTTYRLIEKNCRVQLEAYSQALASHGIMVEQKRILHLTKGGKWQEPEFPNKDKEAWMVFGSLKCLYDFRQPEK